MTRKVEVITMGTNNTFKRKEVKYLLTNTQKEGFMALISDYIVADKFSKYTICNVYMDTPNYRLIRRSIEKPDYKEKMRVRSYGVANEETMVFLELKKKYDGIVYKRRIRMNLDEAIGYIAGEASRSGQIEDEIDYFLELYENISPAMYIAYDRQAFSGKEDPDLRVTFDNNIFWRNEDISLTSQVYGNSLLNEDQCLLEIKCADAMPLWLTGALAKHKIYQTSFSKYGMAYMKTLA
jgi:SPX domain protein involved in polyphosphate accumulation